jgi:hypothetical protein
MIPQLIHSKKKPEPSVAIEDEFLFRQNELRNVDLDTEERALMNLQA